MFDTLPFLERRVTMIMELEGKKIFDSATLLGHLTEFHGSLLPSPFFFLLWDQFSSSSHSSSLQATWMVIGPKHSAFSHLAYSLSSLDFMRLGLHITLGEAPQVTDSPPSPLTDSICYCYIFSLVCLSVCLIFLFRAIYLYDIGSNL